MGSQSQTQLRDFHFHLECATGHSRRTEFEFVNEKTTEISFIIIIFL